MPILHSFFICRYLYRSDITNILTPLKGIEKSKRFFLLFRESIRELASFTGNKTYYSMEQTLPLTSSRNITLFGVVVVLSLGQIASTALTFLTKNVLLLQKDC
jgi:hypothetical protein